MWWRRPPRPSSRRGILRWTGGASAQAHTALDGALRLIDGRWVNHPDANRRAQDKVAVSRRAAQLGLDVPGWLVTGNPADAISFAQRSTGSVVVKPLAGGRIDDQRTAFTTRADDLELLEALGPELWIVQHEVPKRCDVRVVCVGDELWAVAIDSQADPASSVDVRAGDIRSLAHRVTEMPPAVRARVIGLVRHFQLVFGAVDFVVDPDGRWWLLEVNPNG